MLTSTGTTDQYESELVITSNWTDRSRTIGIRSQLTALRVKTSRYGGPRSVALCRSSSSTLQVQARGQDGLVPQVVADEPRIDLGAGHVRTGRVTKPVRGGSAKDVCARSEFVIKSLPSLRNTLEDLLHDFMHRPARQGSTLPAYWREEASRLAR